MKLMTTVLAVLAIAGFANAAALQIGDGSDLIVDPGATQVTLTLNITGDLQEGLGALNAGNLTASAAGKLTLDAMIFNFTYYAGAWGSYTTHVDPLGGWNAGLGMYDVNKPIDTVAHNTVGDNDNWGLWDGGDGSDRTGPGNLMTVVIGANLAPGESVELTLAALDLAVVSAVIPGGPPLFNDTYEYASGLAVDSDTITITATPEPATMLLLLAGVPFLRRRRA